MDRYESLSENPSDQTPNIGDNIELESRSERQGKAASSKVDSKEADTGHQLDPATLLFMRNYSFLFLGYSRFHYFWEIVIICRKGLLALIGVALSFDKRAQVSEFT